MPWLPQGLENLRYWAALLDVPVVGIAGIKIGNIAEVAAQGVASAAVITAITEAEQPAQACKELLQQFAEGHRNFDSHIKSKRARSTLSPEGGELTGRGRWRAKACLPSLTK